MAEVSSFAFIRHLRAEPTSWVMLQKNGKVRKAGRGLSFYFLPIGASIVEVPLDDRELPFLFHAHTRDFQEVTVQGVVTYRVARPEVVSGRINFAIDKDEGLFCEQPLDTIASTLNRLAQQRALDHVARSDLRGLLTSPLEELREIVHSGLTLDEGLREIGLEIVSTRVAKISPTAEMTKALQTPTRENIQQSADEATFQRRALAVEKERAIAENEMTNQIELAKKEEKLIAQRGANVRHQAEERAEAERIGSESQAAQRRVQAASEADAIELLEKAKTDAERDRMEIVKGMPPSALMGLAARELAGKLERIEHLNLSPDVLGPLLQRLGVAGARVLEEGS